MNEKNYKIKTAGTVPIKDVDDNFTSTDVEGALKELAEESSNTDEKVKYDAEDPTAGYVADKIIAGDGISVAEGSGGDENKLVITNSDRHDAVTVTDSAEIDFTLDGQDITASLKSGSIGEAKLDTSVNASLDLADSALQDITSESIGDLSNVDLTDIANDKILKYNSTSSNWEIADDNDTTYEKASGAELDTGTNDTKYATAKALADSEYKKSSELKNSQSTADASSITPTGDYPENEHYVTALEQALTINAPSGTASNGNTLMIRIKDDGTTRSLTWNSAYTWIGTTEPEDTTASKVLYVGAIYNSTSEKWEVLSVVEED
jgi:hypothetical protein